MMSIENNGKPKCLTNEMTSAGGEEDVEVSAHGSCLENGIGRSLWSWDGDCQSSEGEDSEDLGELHFELKG